MNNLAPYIIPSLLVFALAMTAIFLWIFPAKRLQRANHKDETPLDRNLLKSVLKKYGTSSNGIYHLYGSMRHMVLPTRGKQFPPIIGYVNRFKCSLMLTDPICAPDDKMDSIKRFTHSSTEHDLNPILLAIDEETASAAYELGFKLLKIGQEPFFDLDIYDSSKLPKKLRSTISQVTKKGITIEEISVDQIFQADLAASLNVLLSKWFMTRGSDAFKLLTEVAPVNVAEDKKYFIARTAESVEGLLVCSPIYAKNGFFLHDLIRAPSSVNGVAEALIVHALNALKASGYSVASLGVSPLAGLEADSTKTKDFPRIQKILRWTYKNVASTYRFEDLYHFKTKFMPTREEPVYMAAKYISIWSVLAVVGVFSSLNLYHQAKFILKKWRHGHDLPKPMAWAVDPSRVLLPPLSSFDYRTIFFRLKFTLIMIFLNIYTFIYTTDLTGKLDQNILAEHGFSYANFGQSSWFILVTSNFVHFHYVHLTANMIGLLFFGGALETLGGSTLTALVYLISMDANAPTGLILLPTLDFISPEIMKETATYIDVGASLGVMGCFGGLMFLLKRKIALPLLWIVSLIFVGYAIASRELLGVDHAFATIVGYYIAKVFFIHQPSQKSFDVEEIRYFDRRRPRKNRRSEEATRIASLLLVGLVGILSTQRLVAENGTLGGISSQYTPLLLDRSKLLTDPFEGKTVRDQNGLGFVCFVDDAKPFYIVAGQYQTIKAPIGQVAKILENFDSYSKWNKDWVSSNGSPEGHPNLWIMKAEQEVPIPLMANIKNTVIYDIEKLPTKDSPTKIIFRYQLQSSNTLTAYDGIIVLDAKNQETVVSEYDIFDADWGIAKAMGHSKIWNDSLRAMYQSDFALKIASENPTMTINDVLKKSSDAAADKDFDACLKYPKKLSF